VAVDIIGIAANIYWLHVAAKPLLIPALILYLAISKTFTPGKNLLLAGLIFSWLGDLFLLFENSNSLFFIFGLIAFLATHIFYIVYFLKIKSPAASFLYKKPLVILLVLGYGATLLFFLYPHLNDLKLPVTVYATVICLMLLCSLHVYLKVNAPANLLYIFGALLFVLSDSLLALNKFYRPFKSAGMGIMLTYCAAQYFIVKGFIKQQNNDKGSIAF
jgi:uncharacterized membrane protein YhhN